jgi:hypothetical protein
MERRLWVTVGARPSQEAPVTLYPEQERALAYARRRGTEAPLAAIRQRVAATYALFEERVSEIPADVARRRPSPELGSGSWSVLEVVDHLVESDTPAAGQLVSLVAGRDEAEPIPAGLQSDDPLALDWDALRERFREVHRSILDLLDGASDDLPQNATAPVVMVVKHARPDGSLEPVHWIERFDWKAFAVLIHAHNREHVDQVERILAAVAPGEAPAEEEG